MQVEVTLIAVEDAVTLRAGLEDRLAADAREVDAESATTELQVADLLRPDLARAVGHPVGAGGRRGDFGVAALSSAVYLLW